MYSGDSGFSEKLITSARNADIAVVEASVSSKMFEELGPRPNHLSPYECGLIAAKAGVKKLVLSHLYDTATKGQIVKEARKNFSGKIIVSRDLEVVRA